MSQPAIQVSDLSKRYRLGVARGGERTMREAIHALAGRLLRRGSTRKQDASSQEFWGLRDVSFAVSPGEVLGVVGRNGAGKSTLLKILSQITPPTTGRAVIHGRVASLLEVGTGFHPELTGRENIYLNGAILGMRRGEITRKFDQIVDFAGVEQFLDTPVKRYSSGMYVRLAFSVAAHLEPEVLIVDEVLAVGDAAFQRKCLGKIHDVAANHGRTVLLVSHNMAAIGGLCTRAILLDHGRITAEGKPDHVIESYLGNSEHGSGVSYRCTAPPPGLAWVQAATLSAPDAQPGAGFLMSDPVTLDCDICVRQNAHLTLSVQVTEADHRPILHCHSLDGGFTIPSAPGTHRVRVSLPSLSLYPGLYYMKLTLCDAVGARFTHVHAVDQLRFTVRQDYRLVQRPLSRQAGLLFAVPRWSLAHTEDALAA